MTQYSNDIQMPHWRCPPRLAVDRGRLPSVRTLLQSWRPAGNRRWTEASAWRTSEVAITICSSR